MNRSEDVSKLFAMFGEGSTDQYQEIYESEQNRAAKEKWPIFQHVNVGVETSKPVEKTTNKASAPAPKPLFSLLRTAPEDTHLNTQSDSISPTPSSTSQYDSVPLVPASNSGSQPTETKHSGSLGSLFKRLDQQNESTTEPPIEDRVAANKPNPSAIRSLFSRLSN